MFGDITALSASNPLFINGLADIPKVKTKTISHQCDVTFVTVLSGRYNKNVFMLIFVLNYSKNTLYSSFDHFVTLRSHFINNTNKE